MGTGFLERKFFSLFRYFVRLRFGFLEISFFRYFEYYFQENLQGQFRDFRL